MAHLTLVQSVSIAGNDAVPNDDRAGMDAHRAWVIDGATDLGPAGLMGAQGGAAWLAGTADHAFAAAGAGDLSAVVEDVFATLAARFEADRVREPEGRWELPSAAFLACALTEQTLSLAWLGDCACLRLRGQEVQRLGAVPDGVETAHAHALRDAGHEVGPQRSAPVLARLRELRSRAERRVLGVEAHHMAVAYQQVAVEPGDELVLMTDGLAALVDDYGHPLTQFVQLLRTEGLHGLIARLRAVEREDADCRTFTRFKCSDDATGLWLRIA